MESVVAEFAGTVGKIGHELGVFIEFNTEVGEVGEVLVLKVFGLVEEPVGEETEDGVAVSF